MFIIILFQIAFTYSKGSDIWHETNGPYGGRITTIEKNSKGDIFAGTYRNGIFKSTDKGESWFISDTGISEHQEHLIGKRIKSIICVNNDLLFTLTYGDRLYCSKNDGDSWEDIFKEDIGIGDIDFDNEDNLYLSVLFGGDRDRGLYKFSDYGQTWNPIIFFNKKKVYHISIVDSIIFVYADLIHNDNKEGIFKSLDNGKTWTKTIDTEFYPVYFFKAITEKIIFLKADGYLYKSYNGGYNLERDSLRFILNDEKSMFLSENGRLFAAGYKYWGNQNFTLPIYCSLDTGKTWEFMYEEENSVYFTAFMEYENSIIAGKYDGIHVSMDLGKSWKKSSYGLRNIEVNDIFARNGQLYVSTDGRYLYSSIDKGKSWSKPINVSYQKIAVNSKNELAAISFRGELFYSEEYGEKWEQLSQEHVSDVSFDFNDDMYISTYDGHNNKINMLYSTDNGTNWVEIPFPKSHYAFKKEIVKIINDSNNVIRILSGYYYAQTTDNGINWTYQSPSEIFGRLKDFAVEEDGNILVGTQDGHIFRLYHNIHATDFLFKPEDEDGELTSIIIDEYGTIYTSIKNKGIFKSTDKGKNWLKINNGLNNIQVLKLVKGENGVIYATDRGGIYLNKNLTDVPENEFSKNNKDIKVYPNPVINIIKLKSEKKYQRYAIYDIHGQLVQQGSLILNEIQVEKLAPGFYFIRLFNNFYDFGFVEFIKL